jgi:hypothetical protein
MRITREQLNDHMADWLTAKDNPEYGGDLIDWVWDWLISRGSIGPATGPHIHWLMLDDRLKKEEQNAANNPR